MNVDDDKRLALKAARGDGKAFEAIVERYEKTVFNAAYRIAKDPDDAADITQAVFIKVHRKIGTYDPSYKLFSWLYRIAVNEAINYVKRARRMVPVESELGESRESPAGDVAYVETSDQIQHALMELKLDYRIVVVLKYFLELSYAEISEIACIPEKTVKSRLFSARQELRDILIRQGYER
ncbi:MAG: RNA polymerase sigma factor [Candidatus Eisenbacteria bacterium]